jgi:DNA-binding transcriptional ArsR family regulator
MRRWRIWKGYQKKVTPELIERMRELRMQGLSYREIAHQLDLSFTTVMYHLIPEYRQRKIKKQVQREMEKLKNLNYLKRRRTYNLRYIRERYKSDPEFKEKFLSRSAKYQRKIKIRNQAIKISKGAVLVCKYCSKAWSPHVPYVPTYCPSCGRLIVKLPDIVTRGEKGDRIPSKKQLPKRF